MKRKDFLHRVGLGLSSMSMSKPMSELNKLLELETTDRMPVLFLGHGSPMNAIEENEFVQGFRQQATKLAKPNTILVVSAHWETFGTQVTGMEYPKTIHDFGGFPKELFDVQYPAPGNPEFAQHLSENIQPIGSVQVDHKWGLDHGAWSVVKHLFPAADIPVIQLSLNKNLNPRQHFEVASQLQKLRERGILIIGSGNIVHNLGQVAWAKLNDSYAYDWAQEVREQTNSWIMDRNFQNLIDYKKQGTAFKLAIPTPEHYLPLLYALALADQKDDLELFNDKPIGGSLTMTSVRIG